jgi:serine/threonine protein kinase
VVWGLLTAVARIEELVAFCAVNTTPLTPEDPRSVGPYEVTGRLGEGGQGIVYLGRRDGQPCAIKLLHTRFSADDVARERFLREVAVTKRVARFCTAQVLDTDMAGERPYVVSEYVPGRSLRSLIEVEGPRRGAALDRLAINTGTALAAIHQAGVVHRDFKPANVLIGPEGPVVIDFGIARALDASTATATLTGQVIGTPAFMAPEQRAGADPGPAADMFAWAVTMTFAATGTLPGVVSGAGSGSLGGPLGELVTACMAEDPALRPTARQVVDRLLGMGTHEVTRQGFPAGGPPLPDPPTLTGPAFTAGPAPAPNHRRRTVAIAVVAVLVVGVVGAIAAFGGHGGSRHPAALPRTTAAKVRPRPTASKRAHPARTQKPPRPAPVARPNPYSPATLCGSGYKVIDSHRLAGGAAYLLYSASNGDNCVVTMATKSTGKMAMNAMLRVKTGARAADPGRYDFYAGPVRLPARNTCISWGGTIGRSPAWASGWTHCG